MAIENFGSINILINNAGIQYVSPIETFPNEKWEHIVDVNLSAVFMTSKYAIPNMKKNKFGRIINISSAHGIVGSANKAAYVAAKHGVVGLTKSIAIELANENITANAICPGWVMTPLVEKQIQKISEDKSISYEEAERLLLIEKQPMLKFTKPEDIGALALFLCSHNSSTMTGSIVTMDAGWTAI